MDPHKTDTSIVSGAPAEGAATARLLVEETGRPPRVVVIPAGAEVRVGRAADVRCPSMTTARRGCTRCFATTAAR